MVLTSSGEVLTNNHVIDGATSISVTDIGNGRTYSASVVGYDRTDDVAVLQLHGASGLHTVSIGNSSNVAVGDAVVGIGNAGGTGGTPSVAAGSITALDQTITASDEGSGTSEQLSGLLETDANIEPGDSGGPLVNTAGQVVGMDTAGSDSSSAQSATQAYAIPVNRAISLAEQMEAGDRSATVHIGTTAMLGVEVDSTAQNGQGGGFGFGHQSGSDVSGVTIANVVSGSPADDAGLAEGDVITAVGGTSVASPDALSAALAGYHPGSSVQIQWVDQSGQQDSATVTLTAGPPQ
jgi:S1-C subfamily serine protease